MSTDLVALAERIVNATCHLVFIHEEKAVSAGSGVFVEGGRLLTAAHVLLQRPGQLYRGALRLRGSSGVLPCSRFDFRGPVTVDMAIPEAVRPITFDIASLDSPELPPQVQPLPLAKEIAQRGTEVLLAGFTDEIPLPGDLEWALELMNPDMNTAHDYLDVLGKHFVRQPMVKRAIIGCTTPIQIRNHAGEMTVEAAAYVLDNDLTYGGSGGPVMNLQGELLGIVTRKTTTTARELHIQTTTQGGPPLQLQRIFSGSGLALSHRFITAIAEPR